MESLKELFRIGYGPSSSHTMGPRAAMDRFCSRHPECVSYRAKLYGSLAATGKGHLTDKALREAAHKANKSVEILWFPDEFKPFHPNALTIIGLDGQGNEIAEKTYYSIGGGKIVTEDESDLSPVDIYPSDICGTFAKLLSYCNSEGLQIWEVGTEAAEEGCTVLCKGKRLQRHIRW